VIATGLDAVLPLLACPHCARPLTRQLAGTVGCGNGHRFDIARQGYLSLLGKGSRTDTGDSADMVEARSAFLGAGHFGPIAAEISSRVTAGPVLEIGAGTGYYLDVAVLGLRDNRSGPAVGLALDASRYAVRRAAAQGGIGSVVADAWARLPVLDGVVPTVLSVFAPRDPAEITRVLAPGGRLIVATPLPDHLGEIRAQLGLLVVDAGKSERLVDAFDGMLRAVEQSVLRFEMRLAKSDVAALVRMGPAARHLSADRIAAGVGGLPNLTTVTGAVTMSVLGR
jgi:23S rRNA (guanine745-N1)-methyltransferase